MIRFHLDESADGRVARALRRRGMDVTTPTDAGLAAAADHQHLAFALSQNRVLITQDADFLALHHAGIAYYPPGGPLCSSHLAVFRCPFSVCVSAGLPVTTGEALPQ